MANSVCEVLLTEEPLEAPTEGTPAETGAVVDFWGIVRLTEEDAEISGIEYESHPQMAEHQLHAILNEAQQSFDLREVRIWHRIGFVPVAEPSLFVRVGARHRAEAFRAAGWIVDELKKRAPIWKHPRFVAANSSETFQQAPPGASSALR